MSKRKNIERAIREAMELNKALTSKISEIAISHNELVKATLRLVLQFNELSLKVAALEAVHNEQATRQGTSLEYGVQNGSHASPDNDRSGSLFSGTGELEQFRNSPG